MVNFKKKLNLWTQKSKLTHLRIQEMVLYHEVLQTAAQLVACVLAFIPKNERQKQPPSIGFKAKGLRERQISLKSLS